MQYFRVDSDAAGDGSIELSTITVDDLGTAAAADWDALEIYIDTDITFTSSTLIGQVGSWNGVSTAVSDQLDQYCKLEKCGNETCVP